MPAPSTIIPSHNMDAQSDLDRKRNDLIAAVFNGSYREAENIYTAVWRRIKGLSEISENDQKAVNQIHHLLRTFRTEIEKNRVDGLLKIKKRARRKMAGIAREQLKNTKYVEYDDWKENIGVSRRQLRIILKTAATLQITVGCTNCCRRCNEWALAGVRKHFSFDSVSRFTRALFEEGNGSFAHYGASDPLDWRHEGKDISDILKLIKINGYKQEFGILTKIPAGSGAITRKLLDMDADFAVSVTKKNRLKVERLEKAAGKKFQVQHDVEELLTPAGLDEDFSSVKSSITDNYGTEITPDGAFIIVPTFTSALNLTGQRRIPVTSETDCFLEKKVGWEALSVAYFKPLKAIDLNGRGFTLENLLAPQIETILQDNGSGDPTPPGMMNIKEYFDTHEPEIVKNRRKLLPSVRKDLREKYSADGEDSRKILRKKIREYEDFCDMDKVARYKKYAFSFYLNAISGYLNARPSERVIIKRLRGEDAKKYPTAFKALSRGRGHWVEKAIDSSTMGAFELFETLIFGLLRNPREESIRTFIESHPAVYDPESDRFRD